MPRSKASLKAKVLGLVLSMPPEEARDVVDTLRILLARQEPASIPGKARRGQRMPRAVRTTPPVAQQEEAPPPVRRRRRRTLPPEDAGAASTPGMQDTVGDEA